MKDEKGEELVDVDENGNVQKEETENDSQKSNSNKYLLILIICLVVILSIFLLYKSFNKKNPIELIVANNYDEMSLKAAKIVSDLIKKNPNAHLGLATGSTPLGLYNELIRQNKNKELSFKNIKTFNLDEYCGIPRDHSQSYFTYMNDNLFKFIDIDLNNTNIPKGEGDLDSNIKEYEEKLAKYKIDLQLLGVGRNGHIGFNEPGTDFGIGVHVVQLANKTIKDNARFFDNDMDKVPKKAITMGIRNIMEADTIILMANGTYKADAIKNIMSGVVDKNIPATVLNNHKGKVYVIVDKEAASTI